MHTLVVDRQRASRTSVQGLLTNQHELLQVCPYGHVRSIDQESRRPLSRLVG
jgi:hypothetical protein